MDWMLDTDLINAGIKMGAMLLVVLGLMILVLYGMKKYVFPRERVKGDPIIRVLSSLHLSTKERIEVIEVAGERLVLGITPGRISFLTRIDGLNRASAIGEIETGGSDA